MSQSRKPLRIHVIGGSVAGLGAAVAALSHHPNAEVTVHERAPAGALEERGAGIGGDFTVMKKILKADPRDLGFRYILPQGAICERDTRPGKQVRMKGVWTDDDGLLRCTTTYDNIQNTLAKGLSMLGGKYVSNHNLERMEPPKAGGGPTRLVFSGGSIEEADLVICADGEIDKELVS